MPVNEPTHADGHGYTDLNFIIPELVAAEFRYVDRLGAETNTATTEPIRSATVGPGNGEGVAGGAHDAVEGALSY